MKLVQITSRNRRDVWFTGKCESCGATEKNISGYDDSNFWTNVLPDKKCRQPGCGKSTNDAGKQAEIVMPRYPERLQV